MLTVKEVAQDLNVDEETVARLLRVGKLKGIKVGTLWRIDPAALETYKNRSEIKKEEKDESRNHQ